MRAPFQILAIPYRKGRDGYLYCVLRRADNGQVQFVAGGGEDGETPSGAAVREIREETGAVTASVVPLTSMAYVPADVIAERHRAHWGEDVFVIPEYAFGFECDADPVLSDEHSGYEWLGFAGAMEKLRWDSNRTALYELDRRLRAGRI